MAKCAECNQLKTCPASKGTWGCRYPEKEALPWKDLYPPATRIRAIADDIAGQLCAESVDTYSRSPAVTTFIAKILRQWEKDKIKVEAIRTLRDLMEKTCNDNRSPTD